MALTLLPGIKAKEPTDNLEESRLQWLEQLFDIGLGIAQIDNVRELLDKACKTGVVMGHCEGCSVLTVDRQSLRFEAALNIAFPRDTTIKEGGTSATQFFKDFKLPLSHTNIAGHCAITKEIISIADMNNLPPNAMFSYDNSFDKKHGYQTRSLLAVPMMDSKRNVLGVLELINHLSGFSVQPFPQALHEYIGVLANQIGIVLKNVQTAAELRRSREETVMRFVKACESRDHETGGHVERIGSYCALLYKKCGMNDEACEVMRLASMLHDVGKISIPDSILKKPGRLTAEERLIMETHAASGHDLLAGTESPMLIMGATIALMHHEKWNGSGYPNKLSGKNIPLEGRIVALADVFDALSSKRCYKEAWPMEKVLATLNQDAGSHFDPDLVELFMDNIGDLLLIREQHPVEPSEALPLAS